MLQTRGITREAWFDGACEPVNPGGYASFGVFIPPDVAFSGYVGHGEGMTNNVAEYAGVVAALEYLMENKDDEVVIYGDSRLVIEQLSGRWGANTRKPYGKYFLRAKHLAIQFRSLRFEWVPREENAAADELSKMAIAGRLAGRD